MTPLLGAAFIALAAIILYAVLGGADFGGGVWDLLATGPRRETQRHAITEAIGPVWEANHVWLIFAIVALFTCFPLAFADIATNLNAPLTLALLGIVLRGAAFVFRNYAGEATRLARAWTAVFGAASIIAPFFFGVCAGAIATGRYAWTSPFALTVGAFAVALCAQVAAVFLVRETTDPELREDFRRRALGATAAVWVCGVFPPLLARAAEPRLLAALTSPLALGAVATALACGMIVMLLVATRRPIAARIAVGAELVAVLGGWFGAQAPDLIPGRYTYLTAAAPSSTLTAFEIAAICGSLLLFPSLWLLFATFKGAQAATRR